MSSLGDAYEEPGSYTPSFVPGVASYEASRAATDAMDAVPRILMMGGRRAGKSSIQRVVFHKMSPHETLFLTGTNALDIKLVANNPFVQFQIWDLPGDFDVNSSELSYGGEKLTTDMIFSNCSCVVYVIDAQDSPYSIALSRLHDTIARAYAINPQVYFAVLIHKVDGDLFLGDDQKSDCQREIQQAVTRDLQEAGLDVHIGFFMTSIYDHSVFEAFSKVVQHLIPQLATVENLLSALNQHCKVEKAFLFDVVSKLYLCTDSGVVEMPIYELCSDMLDVVVDVSCIYGLKEETDSLAYDEKSASVIRLSNGAQAGMVLYLREVGPYLALVCLFREEHFKKQGLIDFNIGTFKRALMEVFTLERSGVRGERGLLGEGESKAD